MKKKYIKPVIGKEGMNTYSLLTASIKHADSDEAAKGSSSDAVNFARENSFWDDKE